MKEETSVIRKFRITASDGKTYNTNHYNLKAIIAVGNKVDSPRAVQFRKWANGKIQRFDVVVAKNYLTEEELSAMARIVNAYLDLAELRAEEHVPMTMEDWAEQFEGILRLTRKDILTIVIVDAEIDEAES